MAAVEYLAPSAVQRKVLLGLMLLAQAAQELAVAQEAWLAQVARQYPELELQPECRLQEPHLQQFPEQPLQELAGLELVAQADLLQDWEPECSRG